MGVLGKPLGSRKPVSNSSQNLEDSTTTPGTVYFGKAAQGVATSAQAWRIRRVVETAGSESLTHADGNDFYDNVWDNRSSLTYL